MSIVDVTETNLEVERVELWRLGSLERAGYDAESAAVLAASHEVDLHLAMRLLAASPEVDLHRAVSLLERGCSVEVALRILL